MNQYFKISDKINLISGPTEHPKTNDVPEIFPFLPENPTPAITPEITTPDIIPDDPIPGGIPEIYPSPPEEPIPPGGAPEIIPPPAEPILPGNIPEIPLKEPEKENPDSDSFNVFKNLF